MTHISKYTIKVINLAIESKQSGDYFITSYLIDELESLVKIMNDKELFAIAFELEKLAQTKKIKKDNKALLAFELDLCS